MAVLVLLPVLLVALYAGLGYGVVPGLARDYALDQIARLYHRKARLAEVRFDPFSLRIQARGFSLPDADGAPMVEFDRLTVEPSLPGLLRGEIALREIRLDSPRLRLMARADGRVNLQDLVLPESKGDQASVPPAITIGRVAIHLGRVDLIDSAGGAAFAKTLSPVEFTLDRFDTRKGRAAYDLRAASDSGERLAARGWFDAGSNASRGRVTVAGLDLTPLIALAPAAALPCDIQGGRLDLDGGYDLALRDGRLAFTADLPSARLTDLALRARGADRAWVALPLIGVTDLHLDLPAQLVSLGRVEVGGARVEAWRARDGTINLAQFAGPPNLATPALAHPASILSAPAAPGWRIQAPDLRLTDASLSFEERSPASPVRLAASAVNVQVSGFVWPIAAPVRVNVSADLDDGAHLDAKGTADLAKLTADLDLDAEDIGLPRFQPYVEQNSGVKVLEGTVSARGHLAHAGATLAVFRGEVDVDGLHTQDRFLNQDFVNWRAMRLQGVEANAAPLSLYVKHIVADAPYARVVVDPNYVTNVQTVLDPSSALAPPPGKATQTRAPVRGRAPAPLPPPPPGQGLPVRIDLVSIAGGRMDFTDLTTQPRFATGAEALTGTIKDLSGDAHSRAVVDLSGEAGPYAPIKISGQLNLLAARAFTDVSMSFQNLELTTFSPYSGKFAGYRIDEGKLNVDLRYQIADQALHATHKVVITRMQLGEKVDSADAIHMPVKLIIALLKDRNGVIDLPITVDGTLDDPKFRYWPIVWKVVDNVLVKIVTSPFSLLGKLAGRGEELQYVDFAPGSSDLDAAARARLADLAKAMDARPALGLEIPILSDPPADRPVLADAKFQDALAQAAAQTKVPKTLDPAAPRARRLVLTAAYRQLFGAPPTIPKAAPTPGGGHPDADAAAVAWLEAQVRGRLTVSDADLLALARARAEAVESSLVIDGKIAPARVFLVTAPPVAAPAPRMQLAIR